MALVNTEGQRVLTTEMIEMRTKCNKIAMIKSLNLWGNDLCDISVLEKMPALEVLSLSINQISSLAPLRSCFNLTELYLRKNEIEDLSQVLHLRNLKNLRVLWLNDNPCALAPHYRQYVLNVLPGLKKLDSREVTQQEREQAKHFDIAQDPTRGARGSESESSGSGSIASPAASSPDSRYKADSASHRQVAWSGTQSASPMRTAVAGSPTTAPEAIYTYRDDRRDDLQQPPHRPPSEMHFDQPMRNSRSGEVAWPNDGDRPSPKDRRPWPARQPQCQERAWPNVGDQPSPKDRRPWSPTELQCEEMAWPNVGDQPSPGDRPPPPARQPQYQEPAWPNVHDQLNPQDRPPPQARQQQQVPDWTRRRDPKRQRESQMEREQDTFCHPAGWHSPPEEGIASESGPAFIDQNSDAPARLEAMSSPDRRDDGPLQGKAPRPRVDRLTSSNAWLPNSRPIHDDDAETAWRDDFTRSRVDWQQDTADVSHRHDPLSQSDHRSGETRVTSASYPIKPHRHNPDEGASLRQNSSDNVLNAVLGLIKELDVHGLESAKRAIENRQLDL